MILENPRRKPWRRVAGERARNSRRKLFLAALFLALLYTLSIFVIGAYVRGTGFYGQTLRPFLRQNVAVIPKIIRGVQSRPEHITIDIKHKHVMKLAAKRQFALANGMLLASSDDYVPAKIRYKDKIVDVKLRLKGDLEDHWGGDKWSLRVIVRGDNTLFGMKRFSIQAPKTRQHISEWLYHRALKREGLLSLRYEFIDVTLNGKDMGIYALEEHFGKRLIENNGEREGPIIRFNERLSMSEAQRERVGGIRRDKELTGIGSYLSSDIDAFQTQRWVSDPAAYSQYVKAIQLLEAFRRGELKTSEVFNIRKLGKFLAVSDLMGAQHGTTWNNSRFYYNPITSRLEPIGYDGSARWAKPGLVAMLSHINPKVKPSHWELHLQWYEALFDDMRLYEEYIHQLGRLSQASHLDECFAAIDSELRQALDIIYREEPHFEFDKNRYYENQRYMWAVLTPLKGLHAYYRKSLPNQLQLELGNIQYLPIEVLGVSHDGSPLFPATSKIILAGKYRLKPVDYRLVEFALPKGITWPDPPIAALQVKYKIVGTSSIRSAEIFPWSILGDRFAGKDLIRQKTNLDQFDFLVIDEASGSIHIKPGIWDLDQDLVIPEGYRLTCGEGTKLNLRKSAKLLSYSPVEFVGSEEHPIVIHSTDSTGQGLVVLNASNNSTLKHVIFDRLSNPAESGWELTGAVTFYQSPVHISYSQFTRNESEDALNIVRSNFNIKKSFFSQASSDCLDLDFARGKITDSSFVNCGNDAVDVSGSAVELQYVLIDGAGDKGVSVGEKSWMRIDHLDVRNARVAVASKDLSEVIIDTIKASSCQIGFAVYQRKSEYGSASIEAKSVVFTNVRTPYLVEEKSTLAVDGTRVYPSAKNVDAILHGG